MTPDAVPITALIYADHAAHRQEMPELIHLARLVEAAHAAHPGQPRGLPGLPLRMQCETEDACGAWRTLHAGTATFAADLREHIRLENEVLCPDFDG